MLQCAHSRVLGALSLPRYRTFSRSTAITLHSPARWDPNQRIASTKCSTPLSLLRVHWRDATRRSSPRQEVAGTPKRTLKKTRKKTLRRRDRQQWRAQEDPLALSSVSPSKSARSGTYVAPVDGSWIVVSRSSMVQRREGEGKKDLGGEASGR